MYLPETLYISYFLTGSSYICNPPVTTTDIDYMYYVNDLEQAVDALHKQDFLLCGREEYEFIGWTAMRKGNINLILTDNLVYYNKFEAATELAKKRNLLEKKDRIELFRQICTV